MNHTAHASGMPNVTEDGLLGGRLRLLQPERGYRAGMDAALLAAACDSGPGARVLEAGCGVGGALLQAAFRRPDSAFTGLERDPAALALARENVARNGLSARVEIREGDVGQPFSRLGLATFDLVMANPPFFDDPETLRAPAPERRAAWMAEGGLAAWIRFMGKAVRQGGALLVIHRADRLADLLAQMGQACGSVQIRPVHPFADAPAKRVLVRAVKSGRAPLQLLPPLVLHPRGEARHTDAAAAVLAGEAALPWA